MSVPLRKKHGVAAEKTDGERQTVPCGKCAVCLGNRRKEWAYRLLEEQKVSKQSIFLTLTYNDENLVYGSSNQPSVSVRDIQIFFKVLRKSLAKTYRQVRYYCVAEYGTETYRPHYHIILYNACINDYNLLNEKWNKGNIYIGDVNIRSIMYVAKYHVNKGKYPSGVAPPFVLMSRRPGIGNAYIQRMYDYHRANKNAIYYSDYQKKVRLPRYYKKFLYSSEELKANAEQFQDYVKEIREIEKYNKENKNNFFRNQYDAVQNFEKQFINKKTSSKL